MDGSTPSLNLRAASKAATRAKVVKAAAYLFNTRGFIRTTTRDIAELAGLSTGAIFASFSSKEELYAASTGREPPTPEMMDAAAEMLAALKDVLAVADRQTAEFDRARAAIAKAEGQS